MGKTNSKHSEVTDTGVVNSNFIVEEDSIKVPSDIRVLLYIITFGLLLLLVLKIQKAYRRGIKKNLSRSMVLRSQAGDV